MLSYMTACNNNEAKSQYFVSELGIK